MKEFYAGRNVRCILNEENCRSINVWHMSLEEAEVGHMSADMEKVFCFLCVLRGNLVCQINQMREERKAGQGIFINRDSSFRLLESGRGGCELLLLTVEECYVGDGAEGCLTEAYVRPVAEADGFPYMKFSETDRTVSVFEDLCHIRELAETRPPCYEMELKSTVYRIWTELFRAFAKTAPSMKKNTLKEAEKLNRMLRYLHEHYRDKVTLGEMAEACGVSSGEYCRFFKKHMGQTPFEYLQAYRIEQSLPQLLKKSESMTEIAMQHGFGGSSYYAETFKKEMGCTPGDYRKWYLGISGSACPLRKELTGIMEKEAKRESPVRKQETMPAHLL